MRNEKKITYYAVGAKLYNKVFKNCGCFYYGKTVSQVSVLPWLGIE